MNMIYKNKDQSGIHGVAVIEFYKTIPTCGKFLG